MATSPMPIRGVFFDLYGTLFVYDDQVRAWDDWFAVFLNFFRDQGLDMPEDDLREACRGMFDRPEPMHNLRVDGGARNTRRSYRLIRSLIL